MSKAGSILKSGEASGIEALKEVILRLAIARTLEDFYTQPCPPDGKLMRLLQFHLILDR